MGESGEGEKEGERGRGEGGEAFIGVEKNHE